MHLTSKTEEESIRKYFVAHSSNIVRDVTRGEWWSSSGSGGRETKKKTTASQKRKAASRKRCSKSERERERDAM